MAYGSTSRRLSDGDADRPIGALGGRTQSHSSQSGAEPGPGSWLLPCHQERESGQQPGCLLAWLTRSPFPETAPGAQECWGDE